MEKAIEYVTSLWGKSIDTLDSLEVVPGVTILSVLLGVIVVVTIIGFVFKGGEGD